MPLSWNEIKDRAIRFSKDWESVTSEDAEAKSFWDDFFNVFGISRRKVATFEQPVKRLDESTGYIDLLWKGTILVEHKSRGKNLDKAYKQALDYFPGLKDFELPKYVLVSDFARFRLYDLDEGTRHEFELKEFHKHVKEFGFIAGYVKHVFKEQDPVNIKAAELMGRLHDKLKAVGYTGHPLEVYLVRLLFCLFAEDTSIFERDQFYDFLQNKTKEDGSDLAAQLSQLFFILNTPESKRLTNLDEELNAFPYVNGRLFEEVLPLASFDSSMRAILLECLSLDWGKISPAIFGSLFQSVMKPEERRNLGAHYTSENNILKVIKPLFLDDLWKEFETVKDNRKKLVQFQDKLASLRFLDPACGCGNFLVISYRELRLLELEIIKVLNKTQLTTDVSELIKLDVDRFYGIEIEEFPSQIAQVAMWLMDHQMNMRVSEEFGQYFVRLPLKKSANIVCANSLRIDWQSLIEPIPWEQKEQRFDYIFGNPPFVGKHLMNSGQREDMANVFLGVKGAGVLDFVSAWYIRAAQYLEESPSHLTKCAFVSTNSISQGEQVGILWNELYSKYHINIHFAHRTFKWSNEARGKAAVYVIIIGFGYFNAQNKVIYEYETVVSDSNMIKVSHINPYLIDYKNFVLLKRAKPLCQVPEMQYGSKPVDDGNYMFTSDEKNEFVIKEPRSQNFFKRIIGSQEFINNEERWCLWLTNISPHELSEMPHILDRVNKVRSSRMASKKAPTRDAANTPTLFAEIRQPKSDFIIFPLVSSEFRPYIPIGFLSSEYIVNNRCSVIPNATVYHFGILSSKMHMAWTRCVSGRLEGRFNYSNLIVYNNFPWPENPSEKQKTAVEKAAQRVLDVRQEFPGSSLADLYDPLTMPPVLVKAHQELDKAVDLCYRPQPFTNETRRIEFLFELYDKHTAGIFQEEKKLRSRRKEDVPASE